MTQSGHSKLYPISSSEREAYRDVPGEGVTSVTGLLGFCGVFGAVGTTVVTVDFWPVIDVGSGKPCG
jgi:hypothetical protein